MTTVACSLFSDIQDGLDGEGIEMAYEINIFV